MEKIRFGQLPAIVRFAVGVSIFMVWWLFEQYAINPFLHPYFPGYVVGDPCIWDLGVALLITTLVVWWARDKTRAT